MFYLEQLLGAGFLFLALASIASYSDDLASFRIPLFYNALRPMQERWGHTTGTILYFFGYVLPPLGFGLVFMFGLVF
jgi:hypothetical protein